MLLQARVMMEEMEKLQSVGYKNIAIGDRHVNSTGDVLLTVRLSIIRRDEKSNSLSLDFGDEKSSDLILESGEKQYKVHKNILAARSSVFAELLSKLEGEPKQEDNNDDTIVTIVCDSILEETEEDIAQSNSANEMLDVSTETKKEEADKNPNCKSNCCDRKLADGDDSNKNRLMKKLVITDIPPDTVEELLRYIYTDNISKLEVYSLSLLAASDQYQLPGLKLHCEKHLGENISPLNVAQVLTLSEDYKCETLKKTALAYCGENHQYIMKVGQEDVTIQLITCIMPSGLMILMNGLLPIEILPTIIQFLSVYKIIIIIYPLAYHSKHERHFFLEF